MAVCSCYAPRLGGKVAYLQRPAPRATLRRSSLKCSIPVPRAARPRLFGSLPVAGTSGREARPKVTTDRRTCRLASAAAYDLDRHGEEQVSGHRSEMHGPNPAGRAINWGALLQRVLATAALAAVIYCTVVTAGGLLAWWAHAGSPARATALKLSLNVLVILICSIRMYVPYWKEYLRLPEVFFNWLLKHSVPPLYNHIARSHATTVALVQLAVLDPQRRLQQHLQKIVTSAYVAEPDAKHLVIQDTADLLLSNRDSIVSVYLQGSHPIFDSWSAEVYFNNWCSRERTTLHDSRARQKRKQARLSLDRDTAMEGKQQVTVVTLLVAARGMDSVPEQIKAQSILDMLGRLPLVKKESLGFCQVLWTPVGEETRYTSDDLALDYPQMKAMQS